MEATRAKLTGLRPQAYEHPTDTALLNALEKTRGFDTVVRKLNAWGLEKMLQVQLTGSYLRATPDNFPELHAILKEACDVLDMPLMPDLYIAPGFINAMTAGVERPLILVNTDAIDLLTPDELLFVIAHEVGHVKSGHGLYYQMAMFLPLLADIVGGFTMGIGEIVGIGIEVALLRWQRASEYTADRAGLLACQQAETAVRALTKMAGLPAKYRDSFNSEDFITQAREFQSMDTDKLAMIAKALSMMGATHPWTVLRAQHLLEWIDGGGYEAVLKNPQALPTAGPAPLPPGGFKLCATCSHALRGTERFCPGCGKPTE